MKHSLRSWIELYQHRHTIASALADEVEERRYRVISGCTCADDLVPDEHVEQLDRLGEIMARPNVDLRILPSETTPVWRAARLVIFGELDDEDPFVHLELLTGPINVDGSHEVTMYQQASGR